MTSLPSTTRRQALKTAALGALAFAWRGKAFAADSASSISREGQKHDLRLGLATYSTRMLSLDATLAAMRALRLDAANLYKSHCNWETASVDECRTVGETLRAAGVVLNGSGVVNFAADAVAARKVFENARAAGMATIVCKPQPDALPLVEKLAKEYDQRVAVHNHGPEEKLYPTPDFAWEAVKALDARVGLCIDVGHAARGGADPAATIRRYASRLYDVHLKDSLAVPGARQDIPVEIGAGRLDIRGVLQALRDIKYTGAVAFEYEKAAANPLTGLAESVGYVRGLLAAMA